MKIVFFGTSEVGLPILKSLIAHHEVIHVVTSPDAAIGRKQEVRATPIAQFADEHHIPVSKPEKVKNNSGFLEFLKTLNADIFIVVSYGKILPMELLNIPQFKTVNVHFSLLPKYRGAAPIQFALLNGEIKTGTTIFVLDELVDHGPVLATKEIDIDPNDTFVTLAKKLSELSAELIIEVLPMYQTGKLQSKEQNHDDATPTGLIKKEDGMIDWTKTATEINNQRRAFTPWPGIWTNYKGQILKILDCIPVESPAKEVISCGQGTFLKIIEVQLAGKNKMTFKDFLNGHSDFSEKDIKS